MAKNSYIGWSVCLVVGIGTYFVANRSVKKYKEELVSAKRRLNQRMKEENEKKNLSGTGFDREN